MISYIKTTETPVASTIIEILLYNPQDRTVCQVWQKELSGNIMRLWYVFTEWQGTPKREGQELTGGMTSHWLI